MENHTDDEIKVALNVLDSLKSEYDNDSDEFADISQTQHYIESKFVYGDE